MALSVVDPKWMRKVARRLTSAVGARYGNLTDIRLDRIWQWASRSSRNIEAAFAAAQMLRDLETIDGAEAAYLFSVLYDRYRRKENDDIYEAAGEAFLDGVEIELVRAAERARRAPPLTSFTGSAARRSWPTWCCMSGPCTDSCAPTVSTHCSRASQSRKPKWGLRSYRLRLATSPSELSP